VLIETITEASQNDVRELADWRPARGRVLSLLLDLDPSEFGVVPARQSAVTSLLDQARRAVEGGDWEHDELVGLREDLDRAAALFEEDRWAAGARAVAVYACSPSGLFRPLRLPHPVSTAFVIGDAPWVEPLLDDGADVRGWRVLLVNRRVARLFAGAAGGFEEVAGVSDDTHGQHRQGGWSHPRYERSVEHEVDQHFDHVAEVLRQELAARPFEHLLIAAPGDEPQRFEDRLHADVARTVAGRISCDVENATAAEVTDAAAPAVAEFRRDRVAEAVERVRAGQAHEQSAIGLGPVLEALVERRVEILLAETGFAAPGARCPQCGWLSADGSRPDCPADGTTLEPLQDVVAPAIAMAVEQDAEVFRLPGDHPDLGVLHHIAAVQRF